MPRRTPIRRVVSGIRWGESPVARRRSLTGLRRRRTQSDVRDVEGEDDNHNYCYRHHAFGTTLSRKGTLCPCCRGRYIIELWFMVHPGDTVHTSNQSRSSNKMERSRKKVEWSSNLSSVESAAPEDRSPNWDNETGKQFLSCTSLSFVSRFILTKHSRPSVVLLFGRRTPPKWRYRKPVNAVYND